MCTTVGRANLITVKDSACVVPFMWTQLLVG